MAHMQSRGTVRKLIDEKGKTFVSFLEHDGYFNLVDTALYPAFLEAQKLHQEVFFEHDAALNITVMLDARKFGDKIVKELSPYTSI